MTARVIWTSFGLATAVASALLLASVAAAPTQNAARLAETPAGNILADAVRLVGKADIGLVPGGALRTDPDPNSVAPAVLLDKLVTGQDGIVVVRLKGSQLRAALERSVSYAGKPFSGFLQVSGVTFRYRPEAPVGSRLSALVVAGKPWNADAEYRVAMPRPLADGQLGFFQVWRKEQIQSDTGQSLEDAVKEWAAQRPASVGIEGRIVVEPKR